MKMIWQNHGSGALSMLPHQALGSVFVMRCVVTVLVLGSFAAAQPANRDPVMQSWGELEKVQQCARCHYRPPEGFDRSPRVTERSTQSEARQWVEHDKHAIARRRVEPLTADQVQQVTRQLRQTYGQFADSGKVEQWVGPSNVLSRAICDALGYDVETDDGYSQFRDHCLTCHGGYSADQPAAAPGFARNGTQPGISCIYCHQIGETDAWVDAHDKVAWRLKGPEAKEDLGLRNLVPSAEQAALCLDCHVGNIPKGRFVSHAMYAAGHPPLPGFELQTFSRSMPQHWRTPGELYAALKDYPERDDYFALNYPELFRQDRPSIAPDQVYWNTRNLLIGSIAARRHWLRLISDASQTEHWGDYALYDCAACHHELRTRSPRQERGYPGAPGRPRQLEWATVLTDLASQFSPQADQLRILEDKLDIAFSRQPFGDAAECGEAARQAIEVLTSILDDVAAAPVDRVVATNVLDQILEQPVAKRVDYHSARQAVWALLAIAAEHHAHPYGTRLSEPALGKLKQLGSVSQQGPSVSVILPSGRERFIFPGYLQDELQRQKDYSPEWLQQYLESLHELLSEEE